MAQCGKVTGSRDIQMCGVCSMSLLVDLPKIGSTPRRHYTRRGRPLACQL